MLRTHARKGDRRHRLSGGSGTAAEVGLSHETLHRPATCAFQPRCSLNLGHRSTLSRSPYTRDFRDPVTLYEYSEGTGVQLVGSVG